MPEEDYSLDPAAEDFAEPDAVMPYPESDVQDVVDDDTENA